MKSINIILLSLVVAVFFFSACKDNPQKLTPPDRNADKVFAKDTIKPAQVTNTVFFDFEDCETNRLPEGWSQYYNGKGTTDWRVKQLGQNKVMQQTADNNPNNHFNIAVYDSLEAADVSMSVRFKAISGHYDQGGGLVWRFSDKDNYYVVRANPLEDNLVLYKVENGVRTDLPVLGEGRTYGVKTAKLGKDWHELKLVARDDLFIVFLDGKEMFRVKDSTFTSPGKTGLWTKADAVTAFDDFRIEY